MRRKRLHIHRLLSVLLLWVFALALTPFSAFHSHNHDEPIRCTPHEKPCTHKLHVSTQAEHCLICQAHFEKNYTAFQYHFQAYLVCKPLAKFYSTQSGTYTDLINLALRGPPIV